MGPFWQWERMQRIGTPGQQPYDAGGLAGLAALGYSGPVFIVGLEWKCSGCDRVHREGMAAVRDVTVAATPEYLLLCYRCFRDDGAMGPTRIR